MTVTIRPTASPLRDHYRLIRAIGSDESADDYLANDRRDGSDALIRVIRPGAVPTADARESILGRLAIASGFDRPGVLPIREVGLDAGRVFVVRDRPAGRSIADLLATGPASTGWAAATLASALRTVLAAEEAGILHPGLTPANIFVDAGGDVQVSDTGLPVLPPTSVLPQIVALPPAARVRPPDLVVGSGADISAQVYAVAAMAYWLLSGLPPFGGDTVAEVREAQRSATPLFDAIHGLPGDLAAVFGRAISTDGAVRRAVLPDLLAACDRHTPERAVIPVAPKSKRSFWWPGAVAAAAVIAGISIIVPAGAAIQGLATPAPNDAAPAAPAVVDTAPKTQPVVAIDLLAPRYDRAAGCWGSDWGCVVTELTAIVGQNPNYRDTPAKLAAAHYNRGEAQVLAGDVRGAIASFDSALAIQPGQPDARVAKASAQRFLDGSAAYNAGDWRTAADILGSLADANYPRTTGPAYASYTNLGIVALQSGDNQAAIDAATIALRYDNGPEAAAVALTAQQRITAAQAPRVTTPPRVTQPAAPVVSQPVVPLAPLVNIWLAPQRPPTVILPPGSPQQVPNGKRK